MLTNNGKTLSFTREFTVPVATLYGAWADAKVWMAWWKGLVVTHMEFREGGSYRMEWENNADDHVAGTYLAILPNERIEFSWTAYCKDSAEPDITDTRITLSFRATGPTTSEMTLRHDGLATEGMRDNHFGGWNEALIDLDETYNAPSRDLTSVPAIHITRTVPYPAAKVYEAWTTPQLLNQWFNRQDYTLGKASCNPTVGKGYRLDHQLPNGDVVQHAGKYLELVPNEKLVFSWTSDFCGHVSTVTVRLKAQDGGKATRIDITHEGLTTDAMREIHVTGWTGCLAAIDRVLSESGVAV